MRYYDFDLVLASDLSGEDDVERLFEVFDAAGATITPAVVAGRPLVSVHLEGASLEGAIEHAVRLARAVGADPIGVALEVGRAAA